MKNKKPFTFNISLSVLDSLGRYLYRSFATVLGEAISNSWDADADNVWIYIDKERNSFVIKDDGDGMTSKDFQNKFLKIGYSKRRDGKTRSAKNRPYIGRKGIGKLALLSCAEKISIISKTSGGEYVGGVIDNPTLDDAITSDLVPQKYPLGKVKLDDFTKYMKGHEKGTIIYFENIKDGIKSSLAYIRKTVALYFRFSLIDESFKIFLDDKPITLDDLDDLADRTEFLWIINGLKDPYITKKLKYDKKNQKEDSNLLEPGRPIEMNGDVKGFVASVRLPRYLKIIGDGERIGVDLFVNGRLRERNILEKITTVKVPEDYLYGQVHFNGLEGDKDRFATAREGIVANDEKYTEFLEKMRKVLSTIITDWDTLRRKYHKEGDSDNASIPRRERKAEELFNAVSEEYEVPEDSQKPEKRKEVEGWIWDLTEDAKYSFPSYADCFISENLVRRYIGENKVALTKEARAEIKEFKKREKENKNKGNVSIQLRKAPADTSYLSMDGLATLVDKRDRIKEASLSRDAYEYKPIRDALMHTALLTDDAKKKLKVVFLNIKGRVVTLLSD
ncbi:MAG: ATP-binding protein [Thaumarchaeota archaeon]|nr:ATP-binding protein [Nitrososphaerota archaeon]